MWLYIWKVSWQGGNQTKYIICLSFFFAYRFLKCFAYIYIFFYFFTLHLRDFLAFDKIIYLHLKILVRKKCFSSKPISCLSLIPRFDNFKPTKWWKATSYILMIFRTSFKICSYLCRLAMVGILRKEKEPVGGKLGWHGTFDIF